MVPTELTIAVEDVSPCANHLLLYWSPTARQCQLEPAHELSRVIPHLETDLCTFSKCQFRVIKYSCPLIILVFG